MSLFLPSIIFILSFLITTLSLPKLINYLHLLKFGQAIREEGPQSHIYKKGTPTMGGISFIMAIVFSLLISIIFDFQNFEVYILLIYITLSFFIIGYIDDMLIVVKKKNDGLSPKKKLLMQIIFSLIFYILLKLIYSNVEYLYIPYFKINFYLSFIYVFFIIFWQTGFSNAVNLTDGLDGLATSVTIITTAIFAIFSYKENNFSILLFCLSIIGSLIGFLIFNKKPAKIFMGDTGSLALGGILAAISIILHKEVAFLFIGLVYILETASVILQVAYFKKTGKRIFKMAPLHHHFELSGYGERKTVYIFVIITIISSILGYYIGVN